MPKSMKGQLKLVRREKPEQVAASDDAKVTVLLDTDTRREFRLKLERLDLKQSPVLAGWIREFLEGRRELPTNLTEAELEVVERVLRVYRHRDRGPWELLSLTLEQIGLNLDRRR